MKFKRRGPLVPTLRPPFEVRDLLRAFFLTNTTTTPTTVTESSRPDHLIIIITTEVDDPFAHLRAL